MPLASFDSDSPISTRMSSNSYGCKKISSEHLPENADLDKALSLTEYGRFHYKIIASCAFCLISSGLQNGLSAYVLPAAHCELHLKSSEIGFINAAFLIGGTCSSFLWGVVADLGGRKKVLVITLLLDVVTTFCCSLMQHFVGLVACRFISGFLIGAPSSLTFTYLAEFHAPQHRSKSIYYSGIFYTLSWLLLPLVAWVILPLPVEVKFAGATICSSWRIFLVLLALPELIAGVWMLYLPESPKFLAAKDPKRALTVLKHMYSLNTGRGENDFPVKNIVNDLRTWNPVSDGVNCRGKVARILDDIYSQINSLFKPPLLSLTLLLGGIMFSNMFGYFGLGLWLPELLTRFEEFGEDSSNTSAAVYQLTNLTRMNLENESCFPEFDNALFESTMAMGVSALTGNILSGWLAGKFEHNVIPLAAMLLAGLSAGWIYWINSSLEYLIAACIFQSTITTANIAIGSVIVELFPTSVNAIAMCTATFAGRVGAILSSVIFGLLLDLYCEIAIFLVASVLLTGSILCLIIPSETKIGKEDKSDNKNHAEVSIISVTSM